MGATDEETRHSLAAVVASTPIAWRKTLAAVGHHGELTPVMLAIEKSCERDDTSWHGIFEKVTGINAEGSLTPISWSRQLYDELLLLSAVPHAKA
jgi:hypothetical protein